MYIVVIGWLYVTVMMAVAEATSTTGTVLGAVITFVLYGVAPVALVVYLMRTPQRRLAIRAREAAAQESARRQAASVAPDAGSQASTDTIAPVREKH